MTVPMGQEAPAGLTEAQLAQLERYAALAQGRSAEDLLATARQHLTVAIRAFATNRQVDVGLARVICQRLESALERWCDLPETARHWLGGAVLYYAVSNDDDPDFTDLSGFADDAAVVAACLRFARLDELCMGLYDLGS